MSGFAFLVSGADYSSKGMGAVSFIQTPIAVTSFTLRYSNKKVSIASFLPVTANQLTVTYASNNPSVATIDNNGNVTVVSEGDVTFTATNVYNGVTASITINVRLYAVSASTNPEVMAICYAQGWASNADYLTYDEAQAVTSIGTVFKGTAITHFEELEYFTNVTTLSDGAFMNCSSLRVLKSSNIISIASNIFRGCSSIEEISLPNAINTDSISIAFYQCGSSTTNGAIIDISKFAGTFNSQNFQSTKIKTLKVGDIENFNIYGNFSNCAGFGSFVLNVTKVVTSLNSSGFYPSAPQKIYVPDSLVTSYKADSWWSSYANKIYPISQYSDQ